MKLQLVRSKSNERQLTDVLSVLSAELARIASEEADRLAHNNLLAHEQHEAVLLGLRVLWDIRAAVALFTPRSHNPQEIVLKLGELSSNTSLTIAGHTNSPQAARTLAALARAVYFLNLAAERITRWFNLQEPVVSPYLTTGCQRVLLPSNMLYLYHYYLFPAERMLVVAGTRADAEDTLVLGAAFDVTSEKEGNSSYVKADPDKLSRALHCLDYSNSRLGAWVHSHPGSSIKATFPSDIDLKQHTDWIADFHEDLLSIVMLQSGLFRVFGNAIESGQIKLCIQGQGVVQEEDYVYRLTQEG